MSRARRLLVLLPLAVAVSVGSPAGPLMAAPATPRELPAGARGAGLPEAGAARGPRVAARPGGAAERAAQPTLDDAATAFARLWARGDAAGLTAELASSGLRLSLGSELDGLLAPRQARAALADVLEPHSTVELVVERVSESGGSPAQGFAELRWAGIVPGTEEVIRYTLYAGFVLEEGRWRLAEVRLLR